MKKVLVTGSLGFIFSNFIRRVLDEYPEYKFVGLDKAVHEYNLDNQFSHSNYNFYYADIGDIHLLDRIFKIEKPNIVIGSAAESHVDTSLINIFPFLTSNIIGTQNVINMCLKYNIEKYIHISTDECYGQQLNKDAVPWTEDKLLNPRNPYSASKACAEHIVMAAHNAHNLQFQITRACNVFGPRQKKENLVPHIIHSLINNQPIHIHGDGQNFRQYIYVEDKTFAIMKILQNGKINEVYNIGDDNYFTNLEMVYCLAKLLNKEPKINFIADRKAHDFGYSVSTEKLKAIGWTPKYKFDYAMKKTADWYISQYE
jgi:dTDP-glucose 4,6-dehydratase